jgi:hypothetical protein
LQGHDGERHDHPRQHHDPAHHGGDTQGQYVINFIFNLLINSWTAGHFTQGFISIHLQYLLTGMHNAT